MAAKPEERHGDDEAALAAGIAEVLAERGLSGDAPPRLTPIPGGASRQTWLVELPAARYVLRRDPPGAEAPVSQEAEFGLIRLAASVQVPVARPLHFEPDGGRFGSAGMLMEHVEGESVAPRLLRRPQYEDARTRLPEQLAAALARLHSIDPDAAMEHLPAGGEDAALDAIESWQRELDAIGEPLPALELGLRWLRVNRPDPIRLRLVHGDFRLGNFIVDDSGLRAVIDWELAHIGDPAEDIGWLCIRSWRFGNDEHPVAGLGDLDEFLAAYQAAGGAAIEPQRLRYWEAFGNLKWAVICARQAHDHLSGLRRSHELASLGRRICEPEWDMLELIREAA
jgi:aminoglycoside phosphotransferase (APT) family kinase protein